MFHFPLLILFFQIFITFINPKKTDHLTFDRIKRQTLGNSQMRGFQNGGGLPRNSGAGVSSNNPSGLMTCDKKVDRPANPIDCFQALQSLYQQRPQSGCVVVGSCAIMPLTREYKQKIFPGREPDLNLQVMQSAYNAMFDYYCVNYISPLSNTVSLPENTFVAGFLLGPGLGGHSQPSECSLSLRQRMIQENSIPPPTPT